MFYRESWESKDFCFQRRERDREKKNTKPTKAVKTFGPSVGAANAKQIGGIFFPLRFLNVPLFRAPQVHLHSVLCLVGASAQVNHGLPAKVPVCRVAIIIFCLFICTITDLSFKDTQDLWTSCFNRTKGHHVCSFYGTFFVLSSRLEPLIQTFKHPAAVVKTHDWKFWYNVVYAQHENVTFALNFAHLINMGKIINTVKLSLWSTEYAAVLQICFRRIHFWK